MVSNVCVQFDLPSSVGFTHQPSRMPAKRVDKEMAKAEALQVADYLEKDVLVLKLAQFAVDENVSFSETGSQHTEGEDLALDTDLDKGQVRPVHQSWVDSLVLGVMRDRPDGLIDLTVWFEQGVFLLHSPSVV